MSTAISSVSLFEVSYEVFNDIAAFSSHLWARHIELCSIALEGSFYTAVEESFYTDRFEPQLKKTVASVAEALRQASLYSRYSTTENNIRAKLDNERESPLKALQAAHRQFLKDARELFSLMKDAAEKAISTIQRDAGYRVSSESASVDAKILRRMEEAVAALDNRLNGKGEPFPDELSCCELRTLVSDNIQKKRVR
jgi:hypothetical protein